MNYIGIAIGGAVGAMLRFWLSTLVQAKMGMSFPFGTLSVNIIGALLIGFLFVLFKQKLFVNEFVEAMIIIGVLGGFTTFSTFTFETLILLQAGFWIKAILNVIASVVICLFSAYIGIIIGRYFVPNLI